MASIIPLFEDQSSCSSYIGRDLRGADLSGRDLRGEDLSGADLRGARLMGADLTGASLHGADLTEAELLGARLDGANLASCVARRAGFGRCSLKDALLFDADLEGAMFSGASLAGADLKASKLDSARLVDADLSGADLRRASLREAHMEDAHLGGACFDDADLSGATVRSVHDYESAHFFRADLRGVDFTGAYLFRRHVLDQNYLEEFRRRDWWHRTVYWVWWATSDCGRSLGRWAGWTAVITVLFGLLFSIAGVDYGDHATWLSPYYFSAVTLTTLGYGDVTPATAAAQGLAMVEVFIGYMMLGGMLSIFANKMARRAD